MEKSKFEREIVIDDTKLVDLVTQKGVLVDEGREMAKQMESLAKQHQALLDKQNGLITKVNKIKIDIVRNVKRLIGKELTEFEVPVTTNLVDGKVVFLCADTLGEYKESFSKIDKWREARTPTKKDK